MEWIMASHALAVDVLVEQAGDPAVTEERTLLVKEPI